MGAVTEKEVQDLTTAIVKAVNPVRIILFGSQARGVVREGSDVDLLVIDRHSFGGSRSRRRTIGEIRRSLPPIGRPVDILLFDTREFEKWRLSTNHVIARALREEKVLHERP